MAKPVILGILPSISVILAFKSVFLTKLLASGILFSALANSLLLAGGFLFNKPMANFALFSASDLSISYVVFKTNFVVSMLSTFVTNLSHTVFLTTLFFTTLLSLAKSLGTSANLSISSLSTSVFRPAKFDFSAELLTSTCDTFSKSAFVA